MSKSDLIQANGQIPTTEEAAVYVNILDMLMTFQLLEDSPAVLALRIFFLRRT